MPYKIVVGTSETLQDALNGAFVMNPVNSSKLPLGGLTLIYNDGLPHTITFAGAPGALKTLNEVVTAINAVTAGFASVRASDTGPHTTSLGDGSMQAKKRLVLQQDASFTVSNLGTANSLLGINLTAMFTSAGAVVAANILGFTQGPIQSQLCAVVLY